MSRKNAQSFAEKVALRNDCVFLHLVPYPGDQHRFTFVKNKNFIHVCVSNEVYKEIESMTDGRQYRKYYPMFDKELS